MNAWVYLQFEEYFFLREGKERERHRDSTEKGAGRPVDRQTDMYMYAEEDRGRNRHTQT